MQPPGGAVIYSRVVFLTYFPGSVGRKERGTFGFPEATLRNNRARCARANQWALIRRLQHSAASPEAFLTEPMPADAWLGNVVLG